MRVYKGKDIFYELVRETESHVNHKEIDCLIHSFRL